MRLDVHVISPQVCCQCSDWQTSPPWPWESHQQPEFQLLVWRETWQCWRAPAAGDQRGRGEELEETLSEYSHCVNMWCRLM